MAKMSLAAARVNAGYSQKEAAKKLGIGNKTLCKWENGKSKPTVDKIDAICDIYGLSYDEIDFFRY